MDSERKALVRDALVVLVLFVVAGALCGWLWHHLWAPAPTGLVYNEIPRFDDDVEFRGTGLYLPIAAGAGVLLGLVVTFVFERDELWTLAALIVGSLAAGGVMLAVGHALGPDSAAEFAQHAEDWESVRGDLHASTLPVAVSFPGGAVLGAVIVLSCFTGRHKSEPAG